MESNAINENIDLLFANLEKYLKTEIVVGDPVTIGDIILIPIISVMFGCGLGSGTGHDNKRMNENGSGGGVGARIMPNAILVIKKDEVTMLPIKEVSNLDSILNMVPDIVSKINVKKENNKYEAK